MCFLAFGQKTPAKNSSDRFCIFWDDQNRIGKLQFCVIPNYVKHQFWNLESIFIYARNSKPLAPSVRVHGKNIKFGDDFLR